MGALFDEAVRGMTEAMAKDPVKASTPWAVERTVDKLTRQGATAEDIAAVRANPTAHPEFIRQRDIMQQEFLGPGHRPRLLSDQDKQQFFGLTGKDQGGNFLDTGEMGAALNGLVMRYKHIENGASRVLAELGIHRSLAPVITSANGGFDDLTASIISVDRRLASGSLNDKVAGEKLAVIQGLASKEEGAEAYAAVKKEVLGSGFFQAMFSGDNSPESRDMQQRVLFGFAQLSPQRRTEILTAIDKTTHFVDVAATPAVEGRFMGLANLVWGKSNTKVALNKSWDLKPEHVLRAARDESVMRAVRDKAIEFDHGTDYFEDGRNRLALTQLGISVDDKRGDNYTVRVAGSNDGQLSFSAPQEMTKETLRQLIDKTADDLFSVDKLTMRNDGEQIALIGKDGRTMQRFQPGDLAATISGQMQKDERARAETIYGALSKVAGKKAAATVESAVEALTPSEKYRTKTAEQWRDFNLAFEYVSGITGLNIMGNAMLDAAESGVDAVVDHFLRPLVRDGRRVRDSIIKKSKEE